VCWQVRVAVVRVEMRRVVHWTGCEHTRQQEVRVEPCNNLY
jgi:hypothetical protein